MSKTVLVKCLRKAEATFCICYEKESVRKRIYDFEIELLLHLQLVSENSFVVLLSRSSSTS